MSRVALLTKTFESLESGLVLVRCIGQGYLLALANWEQARMAQTRRMGMQYEGAWQPKAPRFSPYRYG
jgi:hypothetical protein